jgi:hypothetical protein
VTHWFEYPGQHSIAFQLGPVAVHWYGLSYLLGFICVFLWMNRPAGRRRLGLNSDQIQDFLVYALVGVLVGGRIGFVIADVLTQNNLGDYLGHPLKFIAVWEGGMAFHGALIGVVLAIVFFLRKHKGLDFNVLADEIVVLLPIGPIAFCSRDTTAIATLRNSSKAFSTSSFCRCCCSCTGAGRTTGLSRGRGSRITGSAERLRSFGASPGLWFSDSRTASS